MPETRVKTYRVDTPSQVQAQAADTADAAAHGWHVAGREFAPDGSLRVTYQHGRPQGVSEWADAEPTAARPSPATPDAQSRLVSLVAAVGGGMVVAGSFLPWLTVSSGFGGVSRGGLDGGDGWVSAAAGGLLLLLGAASLVGIRVDAAGWLLGVLAALAAGAVGFVDLQDVNARIAGLDSDTLVAQVGMGLWLILAGAVVGGLASIAGMMSRGNAPAGATFTPATREARPKPIPEDTWRA